MENPTLTFATPTVIAGDRSLVGVIAHELAHSWSGNLVTNATWSDSWLNEGFTTYFENRIMEAVYGQQRAAQEAALVWDDMQAAMRELGADRAGAPRSTTTSTIPTARMREIVYDKGATFLRTIEHIVGRARWDAYLRSYFDRHAFQPMTTAGFLADLRANLIRGDRALEAQAASSTTGSTSPACPTMPRGPIRPPSPRSTPRCARSTPAARPTAPPSRAGTGRSGCASSRRSPRQQSEARLAELDRAFHLADSGNSEVLFAWLRLALANRYQPAVPTAERFLSDDGPDATSSCRSSRP